MSEVNEQNTENTETPEKEIEVIESVGFVKEIKDIVTKQVTKDLVFTRFTGGLVEKKIADRATILEKAFSALQKNASENNKIKPKPSGFGADLKPIGMQFTADDVKKLKEYKEKSGKLEAAIKKALAETATDGEWKALEDAVAKNG